MLRWLWLEPGERSELQRYVDQADTSDAPAWFASAYAQARQYRMARSRRWLPSAELVGGDVQAFLRSCLLYTSDAADD